MTDRTVTVSLAANVSAFIANVGRAKTAAEDLNRTVSAASQTQGWAAASTSLLKLGAAATATVALVSKAAVTWQSDWAGVQKTVDGTTQQMDALEASLRTMATTMPATHTQIAAVAEAAGQLGVRTEDVARFSEVMIQLGETTNLTADTAATMIAQFANIMGTGTGEVDRLGAALVQLGNNGASTEAEIMALAHRLAGVGSQMRMTTADVLGMANAMASVGIEAEAGGTAMTLTLKGIDAAVRSGSAELEVYARTAGMTAEQFVQAWGQDAATATASFVEGLGRIKGEGGDVNAVLDQLGITGIRQADTLIRLAGATRAAGAETDLLRDSLEMGADAYAANTALTDEYGKRVATAAAQIQIAWNTIRDAAISAGESTLPVVAAVAAGVADAARTISELPPAVLAAGTGLAAFIGLGALAAGGLMKTVTSVAAFSAAMSTMPGWAQTGVGALGRLGAAAALTAAGLVALNLAGSAIQTQLDKARLSVDSMEIALRTATSSVGDMTDLSRSFSQALAGTSVNAQDLGDALKMYGTYAGTASQKIEDVIMGLAGMTGNVTMVGEELAKVDAVMVSMSREDAAAVFRLVAAEAERAGADINVVAGAFEGYRNSLEASAQAVGVHNLTQQEMLDWMAGTEPAAVGAATALQQLGYTHLDAAASADQQAAALRATIDLMNEAAAAALAASNSQIGYAAALDKATVASVEGGIVIDELTGQINVFANETSRNAQQALNNVAAAHLKAADDARTNGASIAEVNALTLAARDNFINVAQQMGLSADAAIMLADSYGLIPAKSTTEVSAPGAETSQAEVERLHQAIKDLPPETQAWIKSLLDRAGIDAAIAGLAAIQDKTVTITTIHQSLSLENREAYNIGAPGRASGGVVRGPGTSTSDSILARISDGEYIIRTAAARRIGYDRLDWINATGSLPAFAQGGRASLPDRIQQVPLRWEAAPATNLAGAGGGLTRADLQDLRIELTDPRGVIGDRFAARLVLAHRRG